MNIRSRRAGARHAEQVRQTMFPIVNESESNIGLNQTPIQVELRAEDFIEQSNTGEGMQQVADNTRTTQGIYSMALEHGGATYTPRSLTREDWEGMVTTLSNSSIGSVSLEDQLRPYQDYTNRMWREMDVTGRTGNVAPVRTSEQVIDEINRTGIIFNNSNTNNPMNNIETTEYQTTEEINSTDFSPEMEIELHRALACRLINEMPYDEMKRLFKLTGVNRTNRRTGESSMSRYTVKLKVKRRNVR